MEEKDKKKKKRNKAIQEAIKKTKEKHADKATYRDQEEAPKASVAKSRKSKDKDLAKKLLQIKIAKSS